MIVKETILHGCSVSAEICTDITEQRNSFTAGVLVASSIFNHQQNEQGAWREGVELLTSFETARKDHITVFSQA